MAATEQQPYGTEYSNGQYDQQQEQQNAQDYVTDPNVSYYSEEPGQNYYPNENPPLTTVAADNYATNAEYYPEYATDDTANAYDATNASVTDNNNAVYAEDESSATTYTEENANQQPSGGGLKIGEAAPNYLESETDESAQQILHQQNVDGGGVAPPNNDESDFDFSTAN